MYENCGDGIHELVRHTFAWGPLIPCHAIVITNRIQWSHFHSSRVELLRTPFNFVFFLYAEVRKVCICCERHGQTPNTLLILSVL